MKAILLNVSVTKSVHTNDLLIELDRAYNNSTLFQDHDISVDFIDI